MNAIVTGGSGFIGSNLVEKLLQKGYKVVVLDIKEPANKVAGVEYIQDRVENIARHPIDADVIFHLAAQSRVQPSFKDPSDSLESNCTGTFKVLQYARLIKAKVVYAGSSSKHHNPYDSPYATTKMLGEEVCKMHRECYDVNVEIARFYNVYGPGEALDPVNGNVIGIWRYNLDKGIPLKIVGDGEQKRDFINVLDIVEGLIKIAETDKSHEDAWELGTGSNHSINDLAQMFYEKFEPKFDYIADQKGNYRETLNRNTDARDRLGWTSNRKLIDYIQSL